MTGCGPIASGSTSYSQTYNPYNTILGMIASTTGNVYGVYDMSGGANEYVMGNMSSAGGSYKFYPSSSGFVSSWYNTNTAKYLTAYAYESSGVSNQAAYNRGRLGDATGEVIITSMGSPASWYTSLAHMPYSSYSWFIRGASFYTSYNTSQFYFLYETGDSFEYDSSRAALLKL